tara:strand:+ start:5213 stop:5536 length:324 start_codon:yes stop_codon:yes gene_type:complete
MKNFVLFLFFLAFLNACSTPYLLSPGIEESLGDNHYRISFRGNSYTSENKLKEFFNKRASDICTQTKGNFEIVEQKTEVVDYEDRTDADFAKSFDVELRVIGVFKCK